MLVIRQQIFYVQWKNLEISEMIDERREEEKKRKGSAKKLQSGGCERTEKALVISCNPMSRTLARFQIVWLEENIERKQG